MKDVKEPNCLKYACVGQPAPEKDWPKILKVLSQKLYGPMKSKSAVLVFHMLHTGKKVNSKSDVDKLCLSVTLDLKLLFLADTRIGGINVTARLSYKTASEWSMYNIQQDFDPSEMNESHAGIYIGFTAPRRMTNTWTDGASILATTCLWDGQTAWYVVSKHKTLSKRSRKAIMQKITDLGFDPEKAHTTDCSSCE